MADEEDLIFHMECLDNGKVPKAASGKYHDGDSDEEDAYYICPITDDPVSVKATSDKVTNYYANLVKNEQYSSSSSPRNSFHFKHGTPQLAKHGCGVDRSLEAWEACHPRKQSTYPDPGEEFHGI
uniref:Uncharacterized protein n=1 Tax=Sphaerodactylus townsendi TaxID=933632 RepID=A0ACB8FLM8_9SAUR